MKRVWKNQWHQIGVGGKKGEKDRGEGKGNGNAVGESNGGGGGAPRTKQSVKDTQNIRGAAALKLRPKVVFEKCSELALHNRTSVDQQQ